MNELKHYGVLGMRWGVRKKDEHTNSHQSKGSKRIRIDSSDARDKKSLIQRHKEKLISKYLEKGYSQSAAEIAAKQRMRTEVVLGVIGAVAVTVIAKKALTRVGQDYCDKVIKSGKVIQNINANGREDFKDTPFFAAINRNDKKAYGMLYPNEKRKFAKNSMADTYDGIYRNEIKVIKNIKRASVNNARKILYDKMNSDPEFRKKAIDAMSKTDYGFGVNLDKMYKVDPKRFYDRFNQALATPEFQSKNIHKEFYSALEDKGYNSILDINDTRYSGYKKISKSPTIFFGKNIVEKMGNTKLSDAQIDNNAEKYALEYVAKRLGVKVAKYGAAYAGTKSILDLKFAESKLKDHPDSKLSKKETLEELKKQKTSVKK